MAETKDGHCYVERGPIQGVRTAEKLRRQHHTCNVKRSTGHTHTPTENNTPDTDTHTHDKNNTPHPQTNTSHKHLTRCKGDVVALGKGAVALGARPLWLTPYGVHPTPEKKGGHWCVEGGASQGVRTTETLARQHHTCNV